MGELEEALLALGADGVLNVRDLPLGLDLPTHGISEPIGLPLEGRGGTLMLDTDGIPPDLIISSYRSDSDTPQGGTVLMDGMGDDLIPIEPKSAAISNNQQDSATSAPTIADPARNNENERSSRSRLAFILLWLAGAAAATLLIQLTLPLGDSSDSLPSESVSSTPSTVVAATTGSKDDDATVGDGDEPDPTGGDSSTTEPDERTVIPSTVNIRSSEELDKGFEKAATEARRCGRSVGAIPGQPITVEAAIKSSGDIASIRIVGPSAFTRLGQCVAKAVKSDAKFIRSKQALQTETFTYKM